MMKQLKRYGDDYLQMFHKLLEFALAPEQIKTTESLASFYQGVQRLGEHIKEIEKLRALAHANISYWAADKRMLRQAVTDISVRTMKSVYAYAINTGNEGLALQMKTCRSRWEQENQEDLAGKIQSAINLILPVVSYLGEYNISAETMDAWQNALDAYKHMMIKPALAIERRKTLNAEIQERMKASLLICRNVLDSLILQFKEAHRSYYNEYQNNRKLINRVNRTKLIVRVKNESGKPVDGVKIIQFTGGDEQPAITTADGSAVINVRVRKKKGMEPAYHFRLNYGSIIKYIGPLIIKKGHSLECNFILNKRERNICFPSSLERVNRGSGNLRSGKFDFTGSEETHAQQDQAVPEA